MNKKVIKAMYDYIVSKEEKNPVLTGVHFERERCYASDTRLSPFTTSVVRNMPTKQSESTENL